MFVCLSVYLIRCLFVCSIWFMALREDIFKIILCIYYSLSVYLSVVYIYCWSICLLNSVDNTLYGKMFNYLIALSVYLSIYLIRHVPLREVQF